MIEPSSNSTRVKPPLHPRQNMAVSAMNTKKTDLYIPNTTQHNQMNRVANEYELLLSNLIVTFYQERDIAIPLK